MEERELAERAKTGDTGAFSALVARYRRRTYGYFLSRLRDEDEAEDLCQEAFLKAFVYLRGLRDPARFGPWLFSICRNCLRARWLARAMEADRTEPLGEDHPAAEFAAWESDQTAARTALGLLDAETRTLVCLRHESALSYAQIAKATGISEALVKSRLFRAREKLKSIRPGLEASAFIDPERDAKLKEGIMKNAETVKKAAWILERLALRDQLEMARAASANESFGETLLSRIAELGGGKAFIASIGARLDLREFCDVLAYVDSFTERRLVETLEESDPELAEGIKRSTFVFEDFSLFDAKALSAILARTDGEAFALALSGADCAVRYRILDSMAPADASSTRKAMDEARGGRAECEAARFSLVESARAMFAAGEIELKAVEDGGAIVTVS